MKKALVIEDQNYTAVFVKRALTKEFGFEVQLAENGKEGIARYLNKKPDIIFLDVSMPEMNGLDFIKYLRNNLNDKETHVVVMTAISDKELVAKFIVHGILDYILKPLDYSHLIKRLELIFSKIPDFLPPKEGKLQTENPSESKTDEDKKNPE
jgi:two-component system chemotaxis response regulator CheY